MRQWMAGFLCVVMCVSLIPAAAAEERELSGETALAARLEELGLFLGEGPGADGGGGYALDRAPSRVEAVTMLVRALGKGAQAEGMAKTHPFTDVPSWADGYVSYAYEQGLSKGVSETWFGAEDTATGEMYLTFMLRALGYTEGSDGQFRYTSPWALAAWCGILPPQADRRNFLRADAVDVTCAALFARLKGSETALHESLEAEGAFTAEQFARAFPADPFADYRRLDAAISKELEDRGLVGAQERANVYGYVCHLIVKAEEKEGALVVEALVCTTDAEVLEGSTLGSHGGGAGLWLFRFDPGTLALLEARSGRELDDMGITQEAAFSPEVVEEWSVTELSTGMVWLCAVQAQEAIDSGAVRYRNPTYEEAVAEVTADYHSYAETKRLETDQCTILLGRLSGTPHGSPVVLTLVYKAGSTLGEGVTVSLPLPPEGDLMLNWTDPAELAVSEDGEKLFYSYHYEEALLGTGAREGEVLHEAGTYYYTVDLSTGETTLEIIPD